MLSLRWTLSVGAGRPKGMGLPRPVWLLPESACSANLTPGKTPQGAVLRLLEAVCKLLLHSRAPHLGKASSWHPPTGTLDHGSGSAVEGGWPAGAPVPCAGRCALGLPARNRQCRQAVPHPLSPPELTAPVAVPSSRQPHTSGLC